MRRRIAGRLGWGGGPGSDGAPAFFSPEPQVLEEGEGKLAEEGVVVQATPGAPLEMVEAQLVLHLLVHLLADPASLAQGGQGLERGLGRGVGQVVLPLAGGGVLAYEPCLLARQVLPARPPPGPARRRTRPCVALWCPY